MSTPQQPWSPNPSAPSNPSAPPNASGYGAPAGYGQPPASQAPSSYGAPRAAQGRPSPEPQPAQQQGGPTGELVINLRKPVGAMGMISPLVTIDGHPAPSSWGRNSFVVPAGSHQVDVAQSYLWTYGRAALGVGVAPGTSVDVYYAGPMATFMRGAIGLAPQRRPAQGFFIGILVFVAVVLLIGVLAAVLGNA